MMISRAKAMFGVLLTLTVLTGCKDNPTAAEVCVTGTSGGNPVIIVGGMFDPTMANELVLGSAIQAAGYTHCILELKGTEDLGGLPGTMNTFISAVALKLFTEDVLEWSGAAQVDLVGHSQGALAARSYVKNFGGDAMVGKLVSLAGPNAGTDSTSLSDFFAGPVFSVFGVTCAEVAPCVQMQTGSDFITDLNAGDMTPGSLEYYAFYTNNDELVWYWGEGPGGSPVVKYDNAELGLGASNIEIGEMCPFSIIVDHAGMITDPVPIHMTLDALAGNPISVPPSLCPPQPSINMVAYRPQSETYNAPLQRRAVLEEDEQAIGAGIRINGDDDDGDSLADRDGAEVAGENDLIEVELRFDLEAAPAGTQYVLKRSNGDLRVWASSSKGLAILDGLDEATIAAVASVQSVWVESPNGGEADLTFELRDAQSLEVLASDEVHFYSFSSLVVGLHGEFQFPTDPVFGPNEGISELAVALHKEGYDSHMYVENDVASNGSGPVYDEIVDAVQNRGVTSVALYGFSHGGGSLYDLTERLQANQASIGNFDIVFTGYIDAIENDSDVDLDSETRRPIGTQYHVNYYQQWGFIPPWGNSVGGADVNVNVTSTTWGWLLFHISITTSAQVQAGLYDPLLLRVQR
jgi:triacylglycerol lipase